MRSNHALPKILFIVGVDGSGKTFFTHQLISYLRDMDIEVSHFWSRFTNITSKPLLALTRLTGINYYENNQGVIVGYHDFEKSRWISWFFVVFQVIDVWIVSILKIWPKLFRGNMLICDRGAYDTLVDVMVDTKNCELQSSIISKALPLLLPKRHRVFLLSRDPMKIFETRNDVRFDRNFGLRASLYRACAEKFSWTIVENNGTPQETLAKLVSLLFDQ